LYSIPVFKPFCSPKICEPARDSMFTWGTQITGQVISVPSKSRLGLAPTWTTRVCHSSPR
jgi:hypothetical protein